MCGMACMPIIQRRNGLPKRRTVALLNRGFSLIELVVVISVSTVLTGLLLPALSKVQEGANRVYCASNQRQLGQAMFLFAHDRNGKLPKSEIAASGTHPWDLTAVTESTHGGHRWDGIGWLYAHNYCRTPNCFYCPSHGGNHAYEEYEITWREIGQVGAWTRPSREIQTNYHYAGDVDWVTKRPRRLSEGSKLVLLADGLREFEDLNHTAGVNVLRGDGSVQYVNSPRIRELLWESTIPLIRSVSSFNELWDLISEKQAQQPLAGARD